MSLQYLSTRGQAPTLDFEGVLLAGLAKDGGLYLPQALPHFSAAELHAMRGMSYAELATTVIAPFVEGSIDRDTLEGLVSDAYRDFRHQATAPVIQLDHDQWLLELFHGPTLAFKDFALQLLGRLLDHVLSRRGEKVVIMGATSGDTGSAAIEGCRHCEHVDIFILYPDGRVSEVQRRQMTTVAGDNIHNVAIRGNFDDCQALVKASFVAEPCLPEAGPWLPLTRLIGHESWPKLFITFMPRLLSADRIDQSISRCQRVTLATSMRDTSRIGWACPSTIWSLLPTAMTSCIAC